MYVIDDSEQDKECPREYLDALRNAETGGLAELPQSDVLTGHASGPVKCSAYMEDSMFPVWYGRVEGLNSEN